MQTHSSESVRAHTHTHTHTHTACPALVQEDLVAANKAHGAATEALHSAQADAQRHAEAAAVATTKAQLLAKQAKNAENDAQQARSALAGAEEARAKVEAARADLISRSNNIIKKMQVRASGCPVAISGCKPWMLQWFLWCQWQC
jgi:hypothetical protein